MNSHLKTLIVVACLAPVFTGPAGHAANVGGIAIHGSLSATASESSVLNALGDTKDKLNLNLIDIILNSTHRFDNGLRIGGQVFAYKLGGYKDLTLDFASADYSFSRQFGVRVGRNKLPHGLYNDSQDLDAVRTFASLPLAFYPRTLRATVAALDGVSLYGNLGLGRAGGLDYQVFAGAKEAISGADHPIMRSNSYGLTKASKWTFGDGAHGASVFWNPPVDGLKVGYSILRMLNSKITAVLGSTATLTGTDLALPNAVDAMMGRGTWDNSGLFAGTPANVSGYDVSFRTYSAEYSTGKWVFAAEYALLDLLHGTATIPALARLGRPTASPTSNGFERYYGQVTREATAKLGFGYYYSFVQAQRFATAAVRGQPGNSNKDHAVAASYNLTKWCVVKAEYHLMDGYVLAFLAGAPKPAATESSKWHHVVLKTTISF
jgi:hypothetical protein